MGRKPEGAAENTFKRLGKKLDGLFKSAKEFKEESEVKYADQIEELKRNKEKLKSELSQFKENNKEKFDLVEKRIEKIGDEISDLMNKSSRTKGEGKKE